MQRSLFDGGAVGESERLVHRVDRKIEVSVSKATCDTLDKACLRFQIDGNARASRSHLLRSLAHLIAHVEGELPRAMREAGMTTRPPNGADDSRLDFERRLANAIILAAARTGSIPVRQTRSASGAGARA